MTWITEMKRNGKKIVLGAKTLEELDEKYRNALVVGYQGTGKYKYSLGEA